MLMEWQHREAHQVDALRPDVVHVPFLGQLARLVFRISMQLLSPGLHVEKRPEIPHIDERCLSKLEAQCLNRLG